MKKTILIGMTVFVSFLVSLIAAPAHATNYYAIGPAIVLGDSTTAGGGGYNAVPDLLAAIPDTPLTNITSIATAGDSSLSQLTKWNALDAGIRSAAKYVIVATGLNDSLANGNTVAYMVTVYYQPLINKIRTDSPNARIYTVTMTPARSRWNFLCTANLTPYAYCTGAGTGTGDTSIYALWQGYNTAISGSGPSAVTGMYGVITAQTTDLDDGSGSLAAAYERNPADHIHANNAGRAIIAADWAAKLVADGTWYSDTSVPIVTAFTLPTTSSALTVTISSFTCTDDTAVTGYCVTTVNSSAGCSWTGTATATVTFAAEGNNTAYAWCRDAVPNVSTPGVASITVALPRTPWHH